MIYCTKLIFFLCVCGSTVSLQEPQDIGLVTNAKESVASAIFFSLPAAVL